MLFEIYSPCLTSGTCALALVLLWVLWHFIMLGTTEPSHEWHRPPSKFLSSSDLQLADCCLRVGSLFAPCEIGP